MFDLQHLKNNLSKVPHVQRFWVAYSGGLDSHVLLHAIAGLLPADKIRAIHINHGWHADAVQWTEFCRATCSALGVECEVVAVNAHPSNGESPEAFARDARYAAFAEHLAPGDCLLTAHQKNDQAETLLLQLFRGAGVKGLASMPMLASFAQGYHLRPLLECSREDLEAYAKQHELQWIEDDSNLDTRYDRNYIRHELLPRIQQRWPAAAKTLARVAKHCSETQTLLDLQAANDLLTSQGSRRNSLSASKLLALGDARWQNVFRYWLQQLKMATPSNVHLQHVYQDILTSKPDAEPKVCWDKVIIQRYRDDIYALAARPTAELLTNITWDLTQPLSISNFGLLTAKRTIGQGINADAIQNTIITVRFRQGGERCQPHGRQGSHPLKKLFQEWDVPPWERDRIPLLYCGDDLAAVINYCVCEKYFVLENTPGFIINLIENC